MRSKLAVGGLTVVVAFLLATNPVVVNAAGLITGADIKDNSVKSKDIKDNNLTGNDVKNGSLAGADVQDNSLAGADVQDNSLAGADVQDNSLTGADINESTLVLPAVASVTEGTTDNAIHTLTGGLDTLASVTFTAPADGFVRVSAGASFDSKVAPNSYIAAYLYDGATKIQGNWWDSGDNDGAFDLRQTIDAVSAVTAGAHTYTLRADENLGANFSGYTNAQVIVEFVPTGSAPAGPPIRPGQDLQ
jgi:hypothetical protein